MKLCQNRYHWMQVRRTSTFVGAKDLRRFVVSHDILDCVDEIGDFREKWVVVGESHNCFIVVLWAANIKHGRYVWVHESIQIKMSILDMKGVRVVTYLRE